MIFTTGIMFLVRKLANYIGAIDVPKDDRRVHKVPTPRLGGLGIFFGFLFGYILFGVQSQQMNAILMGSFIIILCGIIDDIKPLDAKSQFLAQLIAACILVFYGNIFVKDITIFGLALNFGIISYPISIIFIVACINIINLIDGMDGLSGGTCAIFYITITVIAFMQGITKELDISLAIIMLGGTLGFLVHNFHPAKIFAGGTGTMFQGYMIAAISLLGYKGATVVSLFVPILILGIPVLDTLFAIIRRVIKKQPFYMPDKLHLHHQLLNLGLSHRNTVLVIYVMNILFATATVIFFQVNQILGKYLYLVIFFLILWLVLRTSIISDKRLKERKSKKK